MNSIKQITLAIFCTQLFGCATVLSDSTTQTMAMKTPAPDGNAGIPDKINILPKNKLVGMYGGKFFIVTIDNNFGTLAGKATQDELIIADKKLTTIQDGKKYINYIFEKNTASNIYSDYATYNVESATVDDKGNVIDISIPISSFKVSNGNWYSVGAGGDLRNYFGLLNSIVVYGNNHFYTYESGKGFTMAKEEINGWKIKDFNLIKNGTLFEAIGAAARSQDKKLAISGSSESTFEISAVTGDLSIISETTATYEGNSILILSSDLTPLREKNRNFEYIMTNYKIKKRKLK